MQMCLLKTSPGEIEDAYTDGKAAACLQRRGRAAVDNVCLCNNFCFLSHVRVIEIDKLAHMFLWTEDLKKNSQSFRVYIACFQNLVQLQKLVSLKLS